jgi:Lon protease-like protein
VAADARIERLPLFPLASVVLFPSARVPLHVFEPRYRQMTAEALAAERRIGMVAVRPEHAGEMADDPALFRIGCAGVIERAVEREDGRFDIVLLGTHRFRILDEEPGTQGRLYRIARAERLDERFDAAREGIPLQGLRADAIDLLSQLLRHLTPAGARAFDPRRFSGIEDATFVNSLCQLLELPLAEKQGLLEAEGPLARCERMVALLQFRVAELAGGLQAPPRTLH